MALLLIILGLFVMLFLSFAVGAFMVVVGIVLLFVPGVPYGYRSWGRRPPP
jgi:uncharacterized membrane protein HdeD (DUF308 family)